MTVNTNSSWLNVEIGMERNLFGLLLPLVILSCIFSSWPNQTKSFSALPRARSLLKPQRPAWLCARAQPPPHLVVAFSQGGERERGGLHGCASSAPILSPWWPRRRGGQARLSPQRWRRGRQGGEVGGLGSRPNGGGEDGKSGVDWPPARRRGWLRPGNVAEKQVWPCGRRDEEEGDHREAGIWVPLAVVK